MKSDDFVRLYLCTFHKTGYFTDYILSVIFVFDILICIEPASAPQGSIQQDLLVKKGITTMKEKECDLQRYRKLHELFENYHFQIF